MTVRQLIEILSEFPDDAEVTDLCGNPVSRAEADRNGEEITAVWIDTDYIFKWEDDLK